MFMLIYYELDEVDLLDLYLDIFNIFIKWRKDFMEECKVLYKVLIWFMKKFGKIIFKDSKVIDKLRVEIKLYLNIVNVVWLLEKIKELE